MSLVYCAGSAKTCMFLPLLMRVILLEISETVIKQNFSKFCHKTKQTKQIEEYFYMPQCCCCKTNADAAAV